MKPTKAILSILMALAILLASPLSARAIGFEAEQIYESVFVIISGNALGSGFALGENCIITNAHVIEDIRDIIVLSYGGEGYEAFVLGINESEDIAVLAVEDESFPYLPAADLSAMKTGDDIYAIGAPKGMTYTLTKGSISAKERRIQNRSYIQIDAPINEGNSGGPLLNDRGEVLGMNTLKMSDSEGIGLAIPIERICTYVESLGMELTGSGNVQSRVDAAEGVPVLSFPVDEEEESCQREEHKEGGSASTAIGWIVAGVSLLGNVLLLCMLSYQKKINRALQYDPRDRTDFEIDVWE